MIDITQYTSWPDLIALMFFIACWIGYAQFAEHEARSDKSLLAVTNRYRTQWMVEMLKRDNRSTDAIMIGNLQRSITFFANTTIFIVLGLVSMLGYQYPVRGARHSVYMGIKNIPAADYFYLCLLQIHLVTAPI